MTKQLFELRRQMNVQERKTTMKKRTIRNIALTVTILVVGCAASAEDRWLCEAHTNKLCIDSPRTFVGFFSSVLECVLACKQTCKSDIVAVQKKGTTNCIKLADYP